MIILLFVGQLFQLFWTWLHPRIWIKLDVEQFKENESQDSLLRKFHLQRGIMRGTVIGAVAVFAAAGIGWNWWLLPLGIGNVALQGGYWLWYFNPALNIDRNLPYVGKYHVSWNPNAAWLDRYIWNKAWEAVKLPGEVNPPAQEDLRVIVVAGPLYKSILQKALLTGILFYLIGLSTAVFGKYY